MVMSAFQAFQRTFGGHLFSRPATATAAFGPDLQGLDHTDHPELLGMRLAFGTCQRILRQGQSYALEILLQARLGILDPLSGSKAFQDSGIDMDDHLASKIKTGIQPQRAKQRFEGIGQNGGSLLSATLLLALTQT